MHNNDECRDETADSPPLPLKSMLRRDYDGKVRLPPPADKLVFGPAVCLDAAPAPSEPLHDIDPAD